jgi:hypothetical protein
MSGVFMSYRREDTEGYAGRLYDRLASRYGSQQVFRDIDTLTPGSDFVKKINTAVGTCDATLVLTGSKWLEPVPTKGRRRIDNRQDFVRLEIQAALKRRKPIIPVLIQGAPMPRQQDLPEDIAPLARLQGAQLTDTRWDYDVEQITKSLDKHVKYRGQPRSAKDVEPEWLRRASDAHEFWMWLRKSDSRRMRTIASWILILIALFIIWIIGSVNNLFN